MLSRTIPALLALILASCVTMPRQYSFANSETYPLSTKQVTQKVQEWFVMNNLPVPQQIGNVLAVEIDVQQLQEFTFSSWDGLIVGKPMSDCAKMGLADKGHFATHATVNILVMEKSESETFVKVNVTYSKPVNESTLGCTSTGVLEQQILDYLRPTTSTGANGQ